jgi:hypothetical protein
MFNPEGEKMKKRVSVFCICLWGILLLLVSGCAANHTLQPGVQKDSSGPWEVALGHRLLNALQEKDFTRLSGTLAEYGGPVLSREDFLLSQKEFSKKFGKIVSCRYLTELAAPLFRNDLFAVTLEREGVQERKIRQELLFRLVTVEKGKNGKPQIVGMGFF